MSRSSTKAGYRSLVNLTTKLSWLQSLLFELQVPNDNLSTIMLAYTRVLHARIKHIELDLYFAREKVMQKELEVHHVQSQDQIADVLIKASSSYNFPALRHKRSELRISALQV